MGAFGSDEVMQLFAALIPKVEECPDQLPFSEVAEVLRSLGSLPRSNEVRQLIAALRSKVQDSSRDYPPVNHPVNHPPDGVDQRLQSCIMHSWEDIANMQQHRAASGWSR